jgi:hypothetical protein
MPSRLPSWKAQLVLAVAVAATVAEAVHCGEDAPLPTAASLSISPAKGIVNLTAIAASADGGTDGTTAIAYTVSGFTKTNHDGIPAESALVQVTLTDPCGAVLGSTGAKFLELAPAQSDACVPVDSLTLRCILSSRGAADFLLKIHTTQHQGCTPSITATSGDAEAVHADVEITNGRGLGTELHVAAPSKIDVDAVGAKFENHLLKCGGLAPNCGSKRRRGVPFSLALSNSQSPTKIGYDIPVGATATIIGRDAGAGTLTVSQQDDCNDATTFARFKFGAAETASSKAFLCADLGGGDYTIIGQIEGDDLASEAATVNVVPQPVVLAIASSAVEGGYNVTVTPTDCDGQSLDTPVELEAEVAGNFAIVSNGGNTFTVTPTPSEDAGFAGTLLKATIGLTSDFCFFRPEAP